jgi:CheY-like chemotaxis protein
MKKKIMIVEDELLIAENIKKSLLKDRYEICAIAVSGEESLELAEKHRPDLVLMDILLSSDMTGVEAAKKMREQFGTAIIFLTAYADEKTLEGAFASDPYGYLVKPVREKDIRTAVKMAFHMIQRENNGVK